MFFFLIDIHALDHARIGLMDDEAAVGDMDFFADFGNSAQFMLNEAADRHGIVA